MELGALFSKTGIFCLKHCFENVCVVLCMCKSVYHEYCDCECYCLEAASNVVDNECMYEWMNG